MDGARKPKVTQLPPSTLVRELAEDRRHFGCVLAIIDEALFVEADQLEALGKALDAIDYRDLRVNSARRLG
jgi:hypothetical protein